MPVRCASERHEVSPSTVYTLCFRGKPSHTRIGLGRGTIRIDEVDLLVYKKSCRSERPRLTPVALTHTKARPS